MTRIIPLSALIIFPFIALVSFISCNPMKQHADLILINGRIQTVDENLTVDEAMAVKDGKILGVGSSVYIMQHFRSGQVCDLRGQYVYPGFIDAHCHFYGYTLTKKTMADLTAARSAEHMLSIIRAYHQQHPSSWIAGRGWNQNDWPVKAFPDLQLLDSVYKDIPVVLIRIDGHVVLVNTAAIRKLGITEQNIERKDQALFRDRRFTGIFFEETADLFKEALPKPSHGEMAAFLAESQQDCFSVGLTTVADAGLSKEKILLLDSLQQAGSLKIGIYAMLENSRENIDYFLRKGIYQTPRLNVRSIKVYADGAMGSRGACLLKPYDDDEAYQGIMMVDPKEIRTICQLAYDHGYQVNTHCIGDSANRIILKIYSEFLLAENDRRWRIEHAQVVDPQDMSLFGSYSVIPSIQAIHATSDMYWAEQRLGKTRIRYAYAYQQLLKQNGWLAGGTDFPIEKMNPALNFYAAVSRKDLKGFPEKGFQKENALSRIEALRSMTIWAAKACFEDNIKGSLEVGKWADFFVTDKDMLTMEEIELPYFQVYQTYIQGKLVYQKK